MEAEIYRELQGVASELLREFSQGTHKYVHITREDGPADDPGEAGEVLYNYEGVTRGISWKYAQRSDVGASDLMTVMPGGIVEPQLSGFIEQPNGRRGKITMIDPRPASGPVVSYVITFER